MEKNLKTKNMIEVIYQAQEKLLDEKIKKANNNVKDKIDENAQKAFISKITNQPEIKKLWEKLEDNNNIKISAYNKEFYEQGFIDGINLILNCLKA